jgi:hypothetical protein
MQKYRDILDKANIDLMLQCMKTRASPQIVTDELINITKKNYTPTSPFFSITDDPKSKHLHKNCKAKQT